MAVPESVLEKIPHLPESPGVYLWRDADGTVLYVGKAKRLRSRVRSYVNSDQLTSVKTRALMQQAAALDTIVVPSEPHALILEANLIKEHRPKYNTALRRDKQRIQLAAESLDFERAAELRDILQHLERLEEPTVVMEVEGGNRDVLGYARDGADACVTWMRIRSGKLLARDHQFFENIDDETDAAVLQAFLV